MAKYDESNENKKIAASESETDIPEWEQYYEENFDPNYMAEDYENEEDEEDEEDYEDEEDKGNEEDIEDDDYDPSEDPHNSDYSEAEKMAGIYMDYNKGHKKMYHDYVNSLPPLDEGEEEKLLERIAEGDLDARKKFIEINLLMAYKCARSFKRKMEMKMPHLAPKMYTMEFVQQANLGMIEAVDRFDIKKGYKFSTYASKWMYKEMYSLIDIKIKESEEKERAIKVGKELEKKYNNSNEKIFEVDRQYKGVDMNEASDADTYENYSIPEGDIDVAKAVAQFVDNYDQIYCYDNYAAIVDEMGKEEAINRILACISELPDMERKVIESRFGINGCESKTNEELAREMHITKDGVRYLEGRALLKLKTQNKDFVDIFE